MLETRPHTFIALYSGETISSARLISASADASLVQLAASIMLQDLGPEEAGPVAEAVDQGRRCALRLVATGGGGIHGEAN